MGGSCVLMKQHEDPYSAEHVRGVATVKPAPSYLVDREGKDAKRGLLDLTRRKGCSGHLGIIRLTPSPQGRSMGLYILRVPDSAVRNRYNLWQRPGHSRRPHWGFEYRIFAGRERGETRDPIKAGERHTLESEMR